MTGNDYSDVIEGVALTTRKNVQKGMDIPVMSGLIEDVKSMPEYNALNQALDNYVMAIKRNLEVALNGNK